MAPFKTVKELFSLAFPIILGQLGQMLIGAGDVFVATLYSTKTVAAIGVATGFLNPVFLFGIGLMMGVSPVMAAKIGRGENMRRSLSSVLFIAFATGTLLSVIMIGASEILVDMAGIEPELVAPVKEYISIVAWSFPFALVFQAGKEYLQAFEDVMAPNLLALFAVVLNIGLNYFLVFGAAGFEGLGGMGLAVASFLIRLLLCLALLGLLMKESWGKVNFALSKEILRLGLPTAAMFFLEVLAFCAVSVLSGKIDVVSAATNNIILVLASLTFMIPLSISSAVAVKVGNAYGSKNYESLEDNAKAALFISLCFTICSAAMFYLFPAAIMRLTSEDSSVIKLGIQVLFIVALFQIVDGAQVTLAGILRGVEKATQTSIMVFVGYWLIGIPLGAWLAFEKKWGVLGLWTGLAVSLSILASSLFIYCLKNRERLRQSMS